VARYVYIGKCEDGKYWLIQGNWVKYVEVIRDDKGRTRRVLRNYAKIIDILKSRELQEKLPKKVLDEVMRIGSNFRDNNQGQVKPQVIGDLDYPYPEICKEYIKQYLKTFTQLTGTDSSSCQEDRQIEGEEQKQESKKLKITYVRNKICHLFTRELYGMISIKVPELQEAKINYDKVMQNIGRDLLRTFQALDCRRYISDEGYVLFPPGQDPCSIEPGSKSCRDFLVCLEISRGVYYDYEKVEDKYVPKILDLRMPLPNKHIVLYIVRDRDISGQVTYETVAKSIDEVYDESIRRVMWAEFDVRVHVEAMVTYIRQLLTAIDEKNRKRIYEMAILELKTFLKSFIENMKKVKEMIIALTENMRGRVPIIDNEGVDTYIHTISSFKDDEFERFALFEILENDKFMNLIAQALKDDRHEIRITGVEPKLKKALAQYLKKKKGTQETGVTNGKAGSTKSEKNSTNKQGS